MDTGLTTIGVTGSNNKYWQLRPDEYSDSKTTSTTTSSAADSSKIHKTGRRGLFPVLYVAVRFSACQIRYIIRPVVMVDCTTAIE